ncbi:hypothetical protein [Brevibacillus sp. NRS-1366]|uniref:hypothetical protein n=1 Tax=Brevibacillus sp. NRS-1366 TaxID=3233899 RepID=UPI003D1F18FB
MRFWEGWYEEKEQLYTVHFGQVGEKGDHYAVLADQVEGRTHQVLQEWADEMKEKGYMEVTNADLRPLTVQFPNLKESDMEFRYTIEQLLDDCLGRTGNGHCNGGDDSRQGLTLTCRVIQMDKAVAVVVQALRETSFLEGVCFYSDQENGQSIPLYISRASTSLAILPIDDVKLLRPLGSDPPHPFFAECGEHGS